MHWAWLGLFWCCHGPIHFNWPGQVATLLLVYPGYVSELHVPNGSSELFGTPPHSLGHCTRFTGLLSVIKSIQVAIRAFGGFGRSCTPQKTYMRLFSTHLHVICMVFIFIFNFINVFIPLFQTYSGTFQGDLLGK